MGNENNDRENSSNDNAVKIARWGLLITVLVLLYTGFHGARILTIRGELGNRAFVAEKITRSYEVKIPRRATDYYQCYNAADGERCIPVGTAASGKKVGEPLETIRIWDGSVYHISDPYLENLSLYLLEFIGFALVGLFCLIKAVFPRFQILQKFNDTRTVKLLDN